MSRSLPFNPDSCQFAPVVRYSGEWHIFDFTEGFEADLVREKQWGIGRYNEKRPGMYTAPHFENRRDIHIGIDFWTPPGEPVFAFCDGRVAYLTDNDRPGDYGPTIVTRHWVAGTPIFALYGHLSKQSLDNLTPGTPVERAQKLGAIGRKSENGGWEPHLHFQLSLHDPGRADMPGVVDEGEREEALRVYPDPRAVLGNLY
ncbi:MAG: peptidoglycan DD-metalloendopeptidase family protein [Balneolaceae bacterium]|nr:peptidoglycan DD-metalloendopeptidase family protein [Balneolaceae bacterium]